MITSDLFNNKLFENAEFGTYYCEQLAKKVFGENPELNSSGSASEVLDAAYTIARNDLGDRRARALFTYDEDFPGDLVTAYAYLQKQGVAENFDDGEPEGETLKNSLHTIIRVATHLDRELDVRDDFPEWVSEKVGSIKELMVNVMDYLISDQEMKRKR